MKILSIILPNNHIDRLVPFLDSLIGKFSSNDSFVCIAHDTNITASNIQDLRKQYPFDIKCTETKWGVSASKYKL